MVRDIWNKEFRSEALELYELLELEPLKQTWKYNLACECREIAWNLKDPFESFEIWIKKLDDMKIPYPIKTNGAWRVHPATRNQMDKRRRENMKNFDKGRKTTIEKAMRENTFIPQLDMGIKDAVKLYLEGKTQSFLSELIEEEDDQYDESE